MSITIRGDATLIRAPIAEVWSVLTDLPHYPCWNPFTVRVESSLVVGGPAVLYVRLIGRKLWPQREIMRVVDPPRTLAWSYAGASPRLVAATRYQTLEAVDDETTLYRTHETFRGLLVPLIMALLGDRLQHGFDSVGPALKAYVEGRSSAGRVG